MCWSYGNFRNAGEGSGLFWSYHHLGGFPEYVFPSTREFSGGGYVRGAKICTMVYKEIRMRLLCFTLTPALP